MMELPDGLELARTTPVFDETSVPSGLLAAHQITEGVWGRLLVVTGAIDFVFEDDVDNARHLTAGDHQVVPPARPHHVRLVGPVTFCVEFHRQPK